MNNSTSITMFQMLQNKTDTELINLIQSSFSLGCTLCIFYRVFDFSSYFKSVKQKREINRKKAQKKEYDRMRKLFEAMKNDELDQISLSTDDEEKVERAQALMDYRLLSFERGQFNTIYSYDDIKDEDYDAQEWQRVLFNRQRMAVGTPAQMKEKLERICEEFDTDEIIMSNLPLGWCPFSRPSL